MATYHLHRWSIGTDTDPWIPPECQKLRLHGYRDQDPRAVRTSHIVEVNGREVKTYSGSIYILEDISSEYLQFLEDTGETYDPENPIRTKKRDK